MNKILQSIVVVLLFAGCKLGDDNLPDKTQEGKKTFGCYVNGEKFHPNYRSASDGLNYYGDKGLSIMVWQYKKSFASDVYLKITIDGYPIEEGKTYRLGAFSDSLGAYGEFSYYEWQTGSDGIRFGNPIVYRTSEQYFGELTISKHDPELRIVSGVFWFDVWTEERAVVKIRDGRFDMQYNMK
ncbi:hypothetical protein [Flavobacterium sp. HSC-61S13]|uniref:hypothetical protein n=1 Tax=Flavobacterium sp. HSC-61S13 TaxID=2910963 RepID=UPI0020A01917|nr:hypothetical protein [Flavobacterium sp. HSC-61S13]MCP1997021.1 hypothetical protein [Flavobacterium sp. HSC-61S13]